VSATRAFNAKPFSLNMGSPLSDFLMFTPHARGRKRSHVQAFAHACANPLFSGGAASQGRPHEASAYDLCIQLCLCLWPILSIVAVRLSRGSLMRLLPMTSAYIIVWFLSEQSDIHFSARFPV